MAYNFRGETVLDNPYADLKGYQGAYQQLFDQGVGLHADSAQARQQWATRLNDVGTQFKQLFTNMVGRAPTNEELSTFYQQHGGSIITQSDHGSGRSENDSVNVRNQIAQYVGDTGQQAAQDYAKMQLEAQQGKANELADLFRTQGRQAISQTESSLLDYQQRLFERLRPNLITSLQAQGLLNTGALNESLAGAAKDLSDAAQSSLLDMNFQNEQGANAIAYGGQAAPYQFKQQQILNQPGYLQSQGANALNMAFDTYNRNLDANNQARLMAYQNKLLQDNRPSFLGTMGQSFAQSFGQSAGSGLANSLGQGLAGPAWKGQSTDPSGLLKLFGGN